MGPILFFSTECMFDAPGHYRAVLPQVGGPSQVVEGSFLLAIDN